MGLDCRDWLDVKEYEFLLNYFIRRQRDTGLAFLDEPLSYDGYSTYDQLATRLMQEAAVAFLETFGKQAPALAYTNLFHLAELELQGKRSSLLAAPRSIN
ncbi:MULTISPECIES: hypothetical protein [Rheinheimera]|uniref:Uncharacterized protein n=1 Tax=Rheinheimera marina TaxID=1774958 RepID=A0ABV9JR05_9GAMM